MLNGSPRRNESEILSPTTGRWSPHLLLNDGAPVYGELSDRARHTATLLYDGRVLVVGGHAQSTNLQAYGPSRASTFLFDSAAGACFMSQVFGSAEDAATSSLDLTQVGTLDWGVYNQVAAPAFIRKAVLGDHAILDPIAIGDSVGVWGANTGPFVTWSDGTPMTASPGPGYNRVAQYGIGVGDGFQLDAPANDRWYDLKVLVSASGGDATVRAAAAAGPPGCGAFESVIPAGATRLVSLRYRLPRESGSLRVTGRVSGHSYVNLHAFALAPLSASQIGFTFEEGEETPDGAVRRFIAHELGHMSGMADCAMSDTCQAMESKGAGKFPPAARECLEMKTWAAGKSARFR